MPSKSKLLEDKTVEELRQMARDKSLSKYSTMKKAGLVNLINKEYTKAEIKSWEKSRSEEEPAEIVKFLCTSDLHLRKDKPERIDALKEILKVAREENVDYVIIAGDLFNKGVDASKLKGGGELRGIFSEVENMEVLITPGNHDEDAYPKGTWLGENVKILSERPFELYQTKHAVFIGVPFPKQTSEGEPIPRFFDILDEIETETDKLKFCITHVTMVGGPYRGGFGSEERDNPLHLSDLQESNFDYFALGHIHQPQEKLIKIEDKIKGCYPGSPVSIDNDETGQREVIIGTIKDGNIYTHPKKLETHYVLRESLIAIPHKEEGCLQDLEKLIENHPKPPAQLRLEVGGFITWKEDRFIREVKKRVEASENVVIDKMKVQTMKYISSALVDTFLEMLDNKELDDDLREKCIKIFFESIYAKWEDDS